MEVAALTSYLPKERGAYAQLGVAAASGLALALKSPEAWLLAIAIFTTLVGSQAFRQLLRACKHADRAPAGLWVFLIILGFLGSSSAFWALNHLPLGQVSACLVPLGPALFLAHAFLTGQEHSPRGELFAAATFSLAAVPIARIGGAPWFQALPLGLLLSLIHIQGSLLVRARMRGHLAWTRMALASGVLSFLITLHLLPRCSPTLAPIILVAGLEHLQKGPKTFRQLGWLLAFTSAAGASFTVWALKSASLHP